MLSQYACLSVRLSVTRQYCVETAKHFLTLFYLRVATRLYYLKVLKRSGLTSDHLLHFYVAVIRPILEYCSPVWNHNLPQYPFKREQFASYSRLREACHTYLLFLTLN